MDEIFIISNDRFFVQKKKFFNSNKNTFTVINCFKKLKKIYLIARTSRKKEKFKDKINNTELISIHKIFELKKKIRIGKILVISLTPYNFLVVCILILMGIKKKNLFLFLRSDGYEEYSIKFGKLGGFLYYAMLSFIKIRSNIISCSTSIKGIANSRLVYPSASNARQHAEPTIPRCPAMYILSDLLIITQSNLKFDTLRLLSIYLFASV